MTIGTEGTEEAEKWDDPRDRETAERLGERLHESARRLQLPAMPPVPAVLRRGRRIRHRRRMAVSVAVVAALAVPVGVANLDALPAGPFSAAGSGSDTRPQTVERGEPVEIGHGLLLAVLGEGMVAVGPPETFDAAVVAAEPNELARNQVRAYVFPDVSETVGGDTVYAGTWRADEPPTRLTVRTAQGEELPATLLTLPDSPTWGAFCVVVPGDQGPVGAFSLYDSGGGPPTVSDMAEAAPAEGSA
ncbi:hypothetical protein E1265_19345 [Streptomyces sp. 8K308]|uniref:hypothetical protein n=1 Tax=Streptomyces sp. 8K308 TaxID=2530388 RepID=UPI00104DDA3B|nr:hypothetical protein [Streptomyces sp. 8K308]TDC20986.1 hypothetical protein E1265_19345 [Streptomyces sp. 8K308]